jgi:hypothetical protein
MSAIPRNSELTTLLRQPAVFVRRYRIPLIVLLLAACADAVTTMLALKKFGVESEVHLVQRLVIKTAGVTAGVPLAKFIQLCFVVFVAAWWRPWCAWILLGCGALYALAAISNHFVLI